MLPGTANVQPCCSAACRAGMKPRERQPSSAIRRGGYGGPRPEQVWAAGNIGFPLFVLEEEKNV